MSNEESAQKGAQLFNQLNLKTAPKIREEQFITMENLDDLNEEETLILMDKWKQQHFPSHRMMGFFVYNVIACGLTMYYTINFKYYSKKFFKPKLYNFKEIVKYGTIQSTIFLSSYFVGAALVTGFYHPIDYIRGYAKIQGRVIDNTLKYDPYVQNYVLYDVMSYFNLSPKLMDQAKHELEDQQKELEEKEFFSNETKELLIKSQEDYAALQKYKKEQELLGKGGDQDN